MSLFDNLFEIKCKHHRLPKQGMNLIDLVYSEQNYSLSREAVIYCEEDCEKSLSYGELFEASDKISEILQLANNKVVSIAIQSFHHLVTSIMLGYIKFSSKILFFLL